MHINLLPEAQGQGWGRKLISVAIKHVQRHHGSALFLGIDPRNDDARRFYKHVGFEHVPTANGENYVLDFEKWKGSEDNER